MTCFFWGKYYDLHGWGFWILRLKKMLPTARAGFSTWPSILILEKPVLNHPWWVLEAFLEIQLKHLIMITGFMSCPQPISVSLWMGQDEEPGPSFLLTTQKSVRGRCKLVGKLWILFKGQHPEKMERPLSSSSIFRNSGCQRFLFRGKGQAGQEGCALSRVFLFSITCLLFRFF